MTAKKVLVLTEQFTQDCPLFEPLRAAGYEVVVNETGRLPDEAQLTAQLAEGVVATIAGGEPYTPAVLAAARDLKIIARWGVGYDKVNVPAATEHGIPLAMAFGQNHESVAEYAHAMALALACGIGRRDAMVKSGAWTFDGFHPGLWGRKAGLIGLGRIGGAMARRLLGQGMEVLVYDPFLTPEAAAAAGVVPVDLETLLAEADLISVHAPSTPETRHTLNDAAFERMKPTAIVVNTSRGPLIDEAALARALAAGKIAGAGLDVFETEPLPADSPLRGFDNVVLSPHVSGMDKMAERRVTERCVRNILAWLEGRPEELTPYVVNPKTLSPTQKDPGQ
ncbi:MAG: phosphoglycerate dehydrogenase [Qingshengfaniella sp.]